MLGKEAFTTSRWFGGQKFHYIIFIFSFFIIHWFRWNWTVLYKIQN